jgi:hypothetical protein
MRQHEAARGPFKALNRVEIPIQPLGRLIISIAVDTSVPWLGDGTLCYNRSGVFMVPFMDTICVMTVAHVCFRVR